MKDATQFHIRPARPEEAGLFYTPHPEEDKRLGTRAEQPRVQGGAAGGRGHAAGERAEKPLRHGAFLL